MKIVHFSETDLGGGAGLSSYRLHRALIARGVDSVFLVSRKFSTDPTVREAFPARWSTMRRLLRERMDRLPLAFHPRRKLTDFSTSWLRSGAAGALARERPDVVHLHWANLGFFGLRDLERLPRPFVWSLKDMWPFTGGCHYAGDCAGFTRQCGSCPLLGSARERDLSRRIFERKRAVFSRLDFRYLCLSRQALELAQSSSLLRERAGQFLPIGVPLDRFQPVERAIARQILGLPADGFLVAFGALRLEDRRKGGDLMEAAARLLGADAAARRLEFVAFGAGAMPARMGSFPVHHLGMLRDEVTIALTLAAADVTVVPSREDAGPSVTIESLACGTPVVGFPIGANRDLITHGANGYLAAPFTAESLAAGLRWAMEHGNPPALRQVARESVKEHHDVSVQAERYLELYRQISGRSTAR